jgi:hypothetical protein
MHTTNIIRRLLDIIDEVENAKAAKEPAQSELLPTYNDDGELVSRFKQIYAILSNKDNKGQYPNSPNEIVTDVESVTTDVGGGPNGIKHPKDIRVKDPRGY